MLESSRVSPWNLESIKPWSLGDPRNDFAKKFVSLVCWYTTTWVNCCVFSCSYLFFKCLSLSKEVGLVGVKAWERSGLSTCLIEICVKWSNGLMKSKTLMFWSSGTASRNVEAVTRNNGRKEVDGILKVNEGEGRFDQLMQMNLSFLFTNERFYLVACINCNVGHMTGEMCHKERLRFLVLNNE